MVRGRKEGGGNEKIKGWKLNVEGKERRVQVEGRAAVGQFGSIALNFEPRSPRVNLDRIFRYLRLAERMYLETEDERLRRKGKRREEASSSPSRGLCDLLPVFSSRSR